MYSGETLTFLKYKIENSRLSFLSELAIQYAVESKRLAIQLCSAHAFHEASKNLELSKMMEDSFLIGDSFPLSMYLKLKDRKFEQVRGVDFMREVLLHSPASLRHAFIGTSPENLIDILRYVESINPNLEAFTLSPNFELDLNSQIDLIIDFLLTKKPNFIWIGLGAPKQFIVTYSVAERLNLPTAAVGAAFDFITGNKREAPKIMRKIGLEWLFRLFQEPRRLFKRYFFGNASFLKLMIKDFLMHLTTSQGESTS